MIKRRAERYLNALRNGLVVRVVHNIHGERRKVEITNKGTDTEEGTFEIATSYDGKETARRKARHSQVSLEILVALREGLKVKIGGKE